MTTSFEMSEGTPAGFIPPDLFEDAAGDGDDIDAEISAGKDRTGFSS